MELTFSPPPTSDVFTTEDMRKVNPVGVANHVDGSNTYAATIEDGSIASEDGVNIIDGTATKDGVNIIDGTANKDGVNIIYGTATKDVDNIIDGKTIKDSVSIVDGTSTKDGVNILEYTAKEVTTIAVTESQVKTLDSTVSINTLITTNLDDLNPCGGEPATDFSPNDATTFLDVQNLDDTVETIYDDISKVLEDILREVCGDATNTNDIKTETNCGECSRNICDANCKNFNGKDNDKNTEINKLTGKTDELELSEISNLMKAKVDEKFEVENCDEFLTKDNFYETKSSIQKLEVNTDGNSDSDQSSIQKLEVSTDTSESIGNSDSDEDMGWNSTTKSNFGDINTRETEAVSPNPNLTVFQLAEQARYRGVPGILDLGSEVNATNDRGETALAVAIRDNDRVARDALLKAGASNDQVRFPFDSVDDQVLEISVAASEGLTRLVVICSTLGVNINARNSLGRNALMLAIERNDLPAVIALVEAGSYYTEAMFIDALRAKNIELFTILLRGVRDKDLRLSDSLVSEILEHPEDMLIQILKDQNTPGQETFLMRAVRMNHLQGVQRLLQAGAGVGKICDGKLALHLAVVFADLRIISLLLANNACVNLPDHVGDTALILATMRNDSEILNLLIDNGALVNYKNREGQTALVKAVSGKFTASVECLLGRGADVSIIDQNGNTALILASMNGSMDVVQMLTQAGADVNMVNSEGETALLAAVAGSRLDTVNFLLDFNVDLNHKNKSGNSALFIAAEQNDVSCVEALLARGADVNQINANGDTALMIASAHGSVEMVKSLLAYEADANLKDVYGKSSLVSCVARYTNVLSGENVCCENFENFADCLEDEKQKLVLIVKSLIEAGADVNDVTNREGNPVLFDVIRAGDLDLVKLFLPTADLEQHDLDGNTAAIVASEAGRLPIVQELLGRGACVNAANSSCLTALHKAIMTSDVDMVKTLIAAGAEVNLDDPDGNVYLNLAQSLDNTDVVEALKTALGLQHDPMKVF